MQYSAVQYKTSRYGKLTATTQHNTTQHSMVSSSIADGEAEAEVDALALANDIRARKNSASNETNKELLSTPSNNESTSTPTPIPIPNDGNPSSSNHDCDDDAGRDDIIYVPAKISFEKANSPIQQHVFVFVAVLAFLLFIAIQMGSYEYDTNTNTGSGKFGDHRLEDRRILHSPVNRFQHRIDRRKNATKAFLEPLLKMALGVPDASSENIYNCDLYLGSSSIPNSGWGMFAGRNYLEGESIRTEYGHHFPPPVTAVNYEHEHEYSDNANVNGNGNARDEDESTRVESKMRTRTTSIPPLSFLLKPHSILSNVRWNNTSSSSSSSPQKLLSSLIATRGIKEGEELFISWDDHPYGPSDRYRHRQSLSSISHGDSGSGSSGKYQYQYDRVFAESLPSLEDFLRADDLIRDAQSLYFGAIKKAEADSNSGSSNNEKKKYRDGNARWNRARDKAKHKHKHNHNRNDLLYKPESAKDIDNGLQLLQKAISRYDPLVARLLPTRVQVLSMYRHRSTNNGENEFPYSSSLLGSLNNQTVVSLTNNAQCMSTLQWQLSTSKPQQATVDTDASCSNSQGIEHEHGQYCASSDSSPSIYHQIVSRKKGFARGDVVLVVPLLVKQDQQQKKQHQRTTTAAVKSKETLNLSESIDGECLLLSKSLSTSSSPQLSICPLGGIEERTNDRSLANVEYRWSNSTLQSIPPKVLSWIMKSPLSSPASLSLENEEQQREILKVRDESYLVHF